MDYIVIVVMPIKCFLYEIPEQRRLVQVPQLEGGEKKIPSNKWRKLRLEFYTFWKGFTDLKNDLFARNICFLSSSL